MPFVCYYTFVFYDVGLRFTLLGCWLVCVGTCYFGVYDLRCFVGGVLVLFGLFVLLRTLLGFLMV